MSKMLDKASPVAEAGRLNTLTFDKVPTTTITRAIWDLTATSPHQPLRKAFERAERLNRPRLIALAETHPNRKGSAIIRRLLAERPLPAAEVRSWLEKLIWEASPRTASASPSVSRRPGSVRQALHPNRPKAGA